MDTNSEAKKLEKDHNLWKVRRKGVLFIGKITKYYKRKYWIDLRALKLFYRNKYHVLKR